MDSVSAGPEAAGVGAGGVGGFEGSSFLGSSFGAPSGKAVLNLPVTRAAMVFLPDGVICFAISSGWANCSIMAGISPPAAEVSIRGLKVVVLPGLAERLPDSINQAVLSWAVGRAVALKFSLRRLSHVGMRTT